MPDKRPSPARLVAPLALVAFVVALLLVLGGSGAGGGGDGGGDSGDSGAGPAEPTLTGTTTAPERKPKRRRATYTVEPGDTLGAIAEETGVSVETIEELNPELDPQALVNGQKIKLRE